MSSGTAENPELIPHKAGFGTAEETCEAAESTPSPNRSWLSQSQMSLMWKNNAINQPFGNGKHATYIW
jgi:hypothetical protein